MTTKSSRKYVSKTTDQPEARFTTSRKCYSWRYLW